MNNINSVMRISLVQLLKQPYQWIWRRAMSWACLDAAGTAVRVWSLRVEVVGDASHCHNDPIQISDDAKVNDPDVRPAQYYNAVRTFRDAVRSKRTVLIGFAYARYRTDD